MTGRFIRVVTAFLTGRLRRLRIHGFSMEPTYGDGEHLLLVTGNDCRQGDVIVFEPVGRISPDPRMQLLAKRVAFLPGQIPHAADPDGNSKIYPPVPTGTVFVLGDNTRSLDSRQLGPIPDESIIGVVIT